MPDDAVFVVNRDEVPAFVTKDGSVIREILAPNNAPVLIRRQSLAEATVPPGAITAAHFHPVTEEIYYILRGVGQMQIGASLRTVIAGDGIAIPPGTVHSIRNDGETELVFLCCCAPAYTHSDTVLVEAPVADTVHR